jgi:hypothetical protein
VIQRPEKERVLELAHRQKYSQPSYGQQPQSYLVAGDFKQAILLACALINVPEAKMPNRDEESEEPKSLPLKNQNPRWSSSEMRSRSASTYAAEGGIETASPLSIDAAAKD